MLKEGLQVMLLGMSLVFFLLSLIVVAVQVMSLIVSRYGQPLPELAPREPIFDKSGSDSEVKAIISASIHAHRAGVRKKS